MVFSTFDIFAALVLLFIGFLFLDAFYKKPFLNYVLYILVSLIGLVLTFILVNGSGNVIALLVGYVLGIGYLLLSIAISKGSRKKHSLLRNFDKIAVVLFLAVLLILNQINTVAMFNVLTIILGIICSAMVFGPIAKNRK